LVVLPGLGLDTWLLAQHLPSQDKFVAFWKQSSRLRGTALLFWLGLMGLLGFVLPRETYPWQIWLPTAVGVAFDSFSLLSFAALRTQNRHATVTIWQSIFAVALFGLAFWLPVSANYVVAFANGRMILSIILALGLLIYRQQQYAQVKQVKITAKQKLWAEGRPFMLAELASAVYVRADISIVSLILGKSATALYGPAINILQASFLAPRAFFLFILPLLSQAFQQDIKKFNQRSTLQLIAQTAIGATTSLLLFFFAADIMNLIFKEAYQGSIQYLRLLSPIPLLRALNFAVGTMLMASNRQALNTKVQMTVALFNVVANLIVISPFGLVGVSIVYVISDVLLLTATTYLLWRSNRYLT
jgi:O-antigen/teichoic acid export membrane protein